jgi:RND family efflux transporter MFP subunit
MATEVSVLAGAEDLAHISIPFLKEQQWVLDFATALAEQSQMAKSLVLAAEIEPRTGGSVDVTAPVAGRLVNDMSIRPVGSQVDHGEKLAEIIPHSGHGEDRPALQLDVAEARDSLELARAGRARVERLVEVGALPGRRQLEARVAEQTAEARVLAAEARLAQLDEMRRGEESEGGRDMRFVLRAPMSGVVAQADATPGASVEQGVLLFRLVTLDRVHIVGALPEAELSRADELVGAELDMPEGGTPVVLNRLISIGRILDSDTRTVPIVYELSTPDRRFAIGQAVSLRVFVSESTEAVTVPESAIVDDAGQSVIFVQVSGESFDRRVVQLGNRESGRVQISGDINVGERIVIRGAPLIRLATLSSQVPVHVH